MDEKEKMRRAVILISGGVDSVTLLHHIIKNLKYEQIFCLSFDYGQRHSQEIDYAKKNANKFSQVFEHEILDISFMGEFLIGSTSLVKGGEQVPSLKDIKLNLDQPITYVPNRNMMMLSIAASYAETKSCYELFYAAQAQDFYGYWDCTREFLCKMNETLSLNRRQPVVVKAPFVDLAKGDIIANGLKLGVNYIDTWTCYRGGAKPCLECPSCVERLKAFESNNCQDPLLLKELD